MKNRIKNTNENCDKKVFKDLGKLAAKFSNCLLREEQNFQTKFSFSTFNLWFIKGSQI